jgi:cAMP-dependent protein kinase regulator
LKKYNPGETFGELSLLYNAPQAASISVLSEQCELFSLDRVTFNSILREYAL